MREKVDIAAAAVTFLAPLTFGFILLFGNIFHWPGGMGTGLVYSIAVVPVGVLAMYRSRTGGIITAAMGTILVIMCLLRNHYPEYYVAVGSISIIGGILHLFRQRW